jgi:flagellar assembly protein FliH
LKGTGRTRNALPNLRAIEEERKEHPDTLEERLPVSQSVEGESLASADLDMEERLRNEFKAGFDEGRRFTEKTLRDDLAAQMAESRDVIGTLTANLLQQYEELYAAAERSVVKLALGIAERIVKREVVFDNEVVLRQIHEGTKRVIGVERIKIRVNPADEQYVREHRSQLLTSADSVRELVIEVDENAERGGCILESDSGNVDALIATQLERIEAAMFGDKREM